MRKRGYLCEKTEHWNSFAHIRHDLFGFIDALCLQIGEKDIGLQVTTTEHLADHIEKIKEECKEKASFWLRSGHRIVLHGWAKRGERGKRKLWTLVERELVSDGKDIIEKL